MPPEGPCLDTHHWPGSVLRSWRSWHGVLNTHHCFPRAFLFLSHLTGEQADTKHRLPWDPSEKQHPWYACTTLTSSEENEVTFDLCCNCWLTSLDFWRTRVPPWESCISLADTPCICVPLTVIATPWEGVLKSSCHLTVPPHETLNKQNTKIWCCER